MKKVMFYCQHILGIGHLVRSMEIVRGLIQDFHVCFINGGEVIPEFDIPPGVEVVNLPAIKTDAEFKELQVVDNLQSLEQVQSIRCNQLLKVFEQFQPDILIVELFPFGRRRFGFELIPLLEKAKVSQTKIVSSLRDIVVTKQDKVRHEQKVCKLMNQYFDLLLIHGDPKFINLEESFSRVKDLKAQVYYTGYVVQPPPEKINHDINSDRPTILVSVGGGRFGHELLDCVVQTAPILEKTLPLHHIQIFTGPFMPQEKFLQLQKMAAGQTNITIDRYTNQLMAYMKQADLSISMSGYNTTMNILMTGVRAMLLPFTGNDDREQSIRANKLAQLGIVKTICQEDLKPEILANKIANYINQKPTAINFDFQGVEKTNTLLQKLLQKQTTAA